MTTAISVVVLDADGDSPAVVISANEEQLQEELGSLSGLALAKICGTYERVRSTAPSTT